MGKSTYEQVRASIAKHKDRVSLNLPKGQLPRIKDIAPGGNVTAYIQALINADFERRAGADAGQDAGQPDAETVTRVLSLQSWYKPDAALYIPVGTKTVAALEKIAKNGESAIQCAARLLGDAIKAAPVGENGHGAPKGAGK